MSVPLIIDDETGEALTSTAEDFVPMAEQVIRSKIIHVLAIWPQLSPSMLQVGIGTALTPKLWHPVLALLEQEGVVIRREVHRKTPLGRDQVYTVLELSTNPPIQG